MSKTTTIEVGRSYTRAIYDNPITCRVTKIDIPDRSVEFLVSGEGVTDQEKPRKLSISLFTRWLNSYGKEQL